MCDWSFDQSCRTATDRTTDRGICDRSHDQSWHLRPIVRFVIPPVAKSCDKPGQFASRRTTERDVLGRMAPPIVSWHDNFHDQSCHCVIRDHPQLVVRPRTTGGTITQDLSATAYDLESQVSSFEHDHRPCCYWFSSSDHPWPMRPVVTWS